MEKKKKKRCIVKALLKYRQWILHLEYNFSGAQTLLLDFISPSYTPSSSHTIPHISSCSAESDGTLDADVCRSPIKLWISGVRRTSTMILRVGRLFCMMPSLKYKKIVQGTFGKISSRRKREELKLCREVSMLIRDNTQGRRAKSWLRQQCQ